MTSKGRLDPNSPNWRPSWVEKFKNGFDDTEHDYGHEDGQLGDMKDDGFRASLSSPPYIDTPVPDDKLDLSLSSPPYADIPQSGGTKGLKEHGTGLTRGERFFTEYGDEGGQLGRMENAGFGASLASPPYAEARIGQESGQEQCGHNDAYGAQEGQLGSMKDKGADASISSPPFEGVTSDRPSKNIVEGGLRMGASSMGDGYGESDGNIGNEWGEDFWTASRMILDNLYAVLKPGAYAFFVVKSYVKNGQLVDFPDQWRQVTEAAGFELTHHIKAWVIERKGAQYDMFTGELIEKVTERKSFFRRLAESHGSPRIDYEEVLVFRKPEPIIAEALALGAQVQVMEYA